MRTLFVFRQDLRVDDNVGLYEAVQASREVVPVFILDTTILSRFPDKDKRLDFLHKALVDLDRKLQQLGSYLHVYYGTPEEIYPELIKKYECQAIFWNKSYGYRALTRDSAARKRCRANDVVCKEWNDFLLVEPDDIKPYKVYSPYYRQWIQVVKKRYIHYTPKHIASIASPAIEHDNQQAYDMLDKGTMIHWSINGWQDVCASFNFAQYGDSRNIPSIEGTTKLSPYIRMGLVSIRKIYQEVRNLAKKSDSLEGYEIFIKELCWREFRNQIAFHFPETRKVAFLEKRRYMKWEENSEWLEKRQQGMTGYPLVDAGMRQLREENRMHNRVRMVVASFLCKDMLADWRLGMQEFERYLLDHDSNVNLGSWQRAASVGADPKPLRIFNPLLQSKRFDPNASYIKKYIPELSHVDPKKIHDPLNNDLGYATPILDHYVRSKEAKKRYVDSQKEYENQKIR